MCLAPEPDIPEPEEEPDENELLITEEEEEKQLADANKRGTQGLQIGLNSGVSGGKRKSGGLSI